MSTPTTPPRSRSRLRRASASAPTKTCRGTSTGPPRTLGAPHALDVRGVGAWAVVFVGPETRAGRALAARFEASELVRLSGSFSGADERLFQAWRDGDLEAAVAAGKSLVSELVGEAPPVARPDGRVVRALEAIEESVGRSPTLARVAQEVHLSPSRLRHLLVEQTGAGFRAHVRWRRLLCVWTLVRAGASLTEAAHAAGFSDSAHLSKVGPADVRAHTVDHLRRPCC